MSDVVQRLRATRHTVPASKDWRLCGEAADEIDRLQAIVAAQKELIWHYEDQADRNLFDDADMPPELVKLEKAVEAAERKSP